jgi:O-antigen/teichoic acid export membrane protein
MRITNEDVIWSFFATFFKAASGALLLPLILKMLPSEEVGLWTIFMSVTLLVNLFDFGFGSSFSRSINYIFSGVKELKVKGFSHTIENGEVDYGLLKGTIDSMKWFYLRISFAVFIFLSTLGTYYISVILQNYNGDKVYAFTAWAILCIINTYSLYTLYYDSILIGKGLIKTSKKIIVFSQIIFLLLASVLLLLGYGIIAIVIAQLIYIIIARFLSHKAFFTKELIARMLNAPSRSKSEVLKVIYPNAIKLGLTAIGGIMVQRSAVFIGSLFVPLSDIASYGMTRQILDLLSGLAPVFVSTYLPLISKNRVEGNLKSVKEIYLRGTAFSIIIFFAGSLMIFFWGNQILKFIGSETTLVPQTIMVVAIFVSFLEMNHTSAAGILLTKNEVPFFLPSIFSGIATALIMYFLLGWTDIGLLSLFLAPFVVDVAYQSWKWPLEVIRDLKISIKDIFNSLFI